MKLHILVKLILFVNYFKLKKQFDNKIYKYFVIDIRDIVLGCGYYGKLCKKLNKH